MRLRRTLVIALAAATFLAACSGGEETPTTTTTSSTTSSTTTTTTPPTLSALTGEPVDDEIAERPVVAVKIDNVDGRSTPQIGINAADLVYEVTVEGNVTRLLAVFQSEDSAPVGPVRSARGSEVGLLEELNSPLFTWHGANNILRREVLESTVIPRSISDIPELFYRDAGRRAPYNSFAAGTEQIRATAPDDATGPTEPILSFADDVTAPPSPLAVPATTVSVTFPAFGGRLSGGEPVRYEWEPTSGKWLRFQAGHAHVDDQGTQVAVDNVIVRFTTAVDSGTIDAAGSRVPTAVVTGEGDAWVFSRGTVTVGTWHKDDNLSRTHYLDADGNEILLTPGTTWISLPYGKGSSSFA